MERAVEGLRRKASDGRNIGFLLGGRERTGNREREREGWDGMREHGAAVRAREGQVEARADKRGAAGSTDSSLETGCWAVGLAASSECCG